MKRFWSTKDENAEVETEQTPEWRAYRRWQERLAAHREAVTDLRARRESALDRIRQASAQAVARVESGESVELTHEAREAARDAALLDRMLGELEPQLEKLRREARVPPSPYHRVGKPPRVPGIRGATWGYLSGPAAGDLP